MISKHQAEAIDMNDCLFCKIAAGKVPSRKVYEDDTFCAFHDAKPAAPVHVLLIPRRHIATLVDCAPQDAPLLGRMMILTAQLAAQLGVAYRGADAGGTSFRTVINTGPGGGQEIYHLHAHLLGGKRPWSRMARAFFSGLHYVTSPFRVFGIAAKCSNVVKVIDKMTSGRN